MTRRRKKRATRFHRLSAFTVALLLAAPARATIYCPPIAGGDLLSTVDVEARIDFLRLRMHHDAARARIWAWSWSGIYSGLTTYNAIQLARATTRDDRIDGWVGTAASAVGVIALGLMPRKVMGDQRLFDRMIAATSRLPDGGDRCALLAEGERLLLRDAASEAFGHGLLIHAGTVLFNFGLGMLLGVGFGHWLQATIVMASGVAVGELQTITSPSDSRETLARYRAGQLAAPAHGDKPRWTVSGGVSPTGANLALTVTF